MLNRTHLLTAVCLSATAGLFVSAVAVAEQQDMTITKSSVTVLPSDKMNSALPAGITSKDLNADKAIEKALKKTEEDALSKNGFDNLINCLVDQDRERIKKSLGSSPLTNVDGTGNKRLNDLAVSLGNTWKSKYNQDFSLDYSKVFTADFIHIMTGEISDPTLLVGHWPLDASRTSSNTAGKVTPDDARIARDKMFGGDVNLEKGRNVAIVHLMGSHGMPGLTASLIHEAGGWKFDVPNTLTGQKLYDSLVANLNFVDLHRSDLPADVNDGYREVAHAVIAALYDVDVSRGTGTALDNGSVRPTNTGSAIDK